MFSTIGAAGLGLILSGLREVEFVGKDKESPSVGERIGNGFLVTATFAAGAFLLSSAGVRLVRKCDPDQQPSGHVEQPTVTQSQSQETYV